MWRGANSTKLSVGVRGTRACMLALYSIMLVLVLQRLYVMFVVDGGFVFGDVTNHYFVAGRTIVEGGNPYDNIFINHPPLMLLLFAAIVAICPYPYGIALFIMSSYFLVPALSYKAIRPFASSGQTLVATWLITLNPLVIYEGVTMIDDDLLVMLMLLGVFIEYRRSPFRAMLLGAFFGGFKFVPLAVSVVATLADRSLGAAVRLKWIMCQLIVFLCTMAIGVVLWGPVTLVRYMNYVDTVKVAWPYMNPYYLYVAGGGLLSDLELRYVAVFLMCSVLAIVLLLMQRTSKAVRPDLNAIVILTLVCVYIGNSTTIYAYYTWIIPFLVLQSLGPLRQGQRITFAALSVVLYTLGFLAAEWADFAWAYGPAWIWVANLGTVYVWTVLVVSLLSSVHTLTHGREEPHDESFGKTDVAATQA